MTSETVEQLSEQVELLLEDNAKLSIAFLGCRLNEVMNELVKTRAEMKQLKQAYDSSREAWRRHTDALKESMKTIERQNQRAGV